MTVLHVGSRTIEVSSVDKVLFPDVGVTKGELAEYYAETADYILPHVKDRPLTMERYPDGLDGEGFYEKHYPEHFPEWVTGVQVALQGDGRQQQVVCNKAATLVYLVDQGCVTPHVWLSRRDKLDAPDRMLFDLDPSGNDFNDVRWAARRVRDVCDELELPCYLMLTGSTGVHVVVPLVRRQTFDTVRAFAQDVTRLLARREPQRLTVEVRKTKRSGRLFLDTTRNAYGQNAVPPYTVRTRPGATVAVPIEWYELGGVESGTYTIKTIRKRLAQKEDPWRHMDKLPSLRKPRMWLDEMLSETDAIA
jgi:bifunctional non-homologous end joining protein LigD